MDWYAGIRARLQCYLVIYFTKKCSRVTLFWYPRKFPVWPDILVFNQGSSVSWYIPVSKQGSSVAWYSGIQAGLQCGLVFWYPSRAPVWPGILVSKQGSSVAWYSGIQIFWFPSKAPEYGLVFWYPSKAPVLPTVVFGYHRNTKLQCNIILVSSQSSDVA